MELEINTKLVHELEQTGKLFPFLSCVPKTENIPKEIQPYLEVSQDQDSFACGYDDVFEKIDKAKNITKEDYNLLLEYVKSEKALAFTEGVNFALQKIKKHINNR